MKLEDIFTYKNLYKSFINVSRGKRHEESFIKYRSNLIINLKNIEYSFKHGNYVKLEYYSFIVSDPKYRVIWATSIDGRIIQDCLCKNYLKDYFEPLLYEYNCACRLNKGVHYAMNRLKEMMINMYKNNNNHYYVVKFDIHKFFDNINHEILKNKLINVLDIEIRDYLFYIIDSFEDGLPLGNQTSQWLALYYLNDLDHAIKLRVSRKYVF